MAALDDLASNLASEKTTSADLIATALQRIDDPAGEGDRTFLHVHRQAAHSKARVADRLRHAASRISPWTGIPLSVKDLFDIAGEVTPAGSKVLKDSPPAAEDAPAVARLRAAGFVVIGRTNMTEFAYSGLGLNPHFGTPLNPHDRQTGLIPGGSSSGAAVSVTDGMAAAALGSDTGGSVRIPAALTGLCGFKPTAARIPTNGVIPLSATLDSVGPIAPTVRCCAILDTILAGGGGQTPEKAALRGISLGVPRNSVLDGLDRHVSRSFERALSSLSSRGVSIVEIALPEFERIPDFYQEGGLPALEAYRWHRELLNRSRERYDPRVAVRILAAENGSRDDHRRLLEGRAAVMAACRERSSAFDALVFPTTAITAPALAAFDSDEFYFKTNALMLRNTCIGNFLDRCALTLPCQEPGTLPVGLTLMGERMADRHVLSIGMAIEPLVRPGERLLSRPQSSAR